MNKYTPETHTTETIRAWPGFPWTFFFAVCAVSVPFWILGKLTSARLMPGLPVSALMFICTAFVACLFSASTGGADAVKRLLARSFDFRRIRSAVWFVQSLLLMPSVFLASYAIMRIAQLPMPKPDVPWSLAPVLFLLFFVTAVGEELAWSATVLDPLQSRVGALPAALIIGVVWALWHVVPFAQAHPSAWWVSGQCLFTVAFRVVLVWLYNTNGRSVFAVVVCHAMYNVAWQMFPNRGSTYNPWIVAAITGLLALIVTLAWGAQTLSGRASNPSFKRDE
jgi:membrane protease YdiL (CAAX protease family)